MIDYTELKRLAEDCKEREIDFNEVSPQQGSTSCDKLVRHYLVAASPDVVLGLIKALEHTTMAAEAEAKELDERNAELELVKAHCNQKALQLVAMDKLISDLQDERDAEIAKLKGNIKHIDNDALLKENHVLREALQAIITDRDDMCFDKEKHVESKYGAYWAPSASMVHSHIIAQARAALAQAEGGV